MSTFTKPGNYKAVSVGTVPVVYATVGGFAERRATWGVEFDFIVEVYWSDGRTTFLKRTYDNFVEFQKQLTESFRVQAQRGVLKLPVFIPKLEGRGLFTRYTRDVAESRETELNSFLKDLLADNPTISSSDPVVQFFKSIPSDPVPCHNETDGTSYIDITLDDDEDEILFAR